MLKKVYNMFCASHIEKEAGNIQLYLDQGAGVEEEALLTIFNCSSYNNNAVDLLGLSGYGEVYKVASNILVDKFVTDVYLVFIYLAVYIEQAFKQELPLYIFETFLILIEKIVSLYYIVQLNSQTTVMYIKLYLPTSNS